MKIRYTKWIEVVLEFEADDMEEISHLAAEIEIVTTTRQITLVDYHTLEGSGVIESLDEAGNPLPETVPFDEGIES